MLVEWVFGVGSGSAPNMGTADTALGFGSGSGSTIVAVTSSGSAIGTSSGSAIGAVASLVDKRSALGGRWIRSVRLKTGLEMKRSLRSYRKGCCVDP